MVRMQDKHDQWIYTRLIDSASYKNAIKIAFAGMPAGTALRLVREPSNKHNPNAVAVFSNSLLIGYLPRNLAAKLAPCIDNGDFFFCEVADPHPDRPCLRIKKYLSGQHCDEDLELENRRQQAYREGWEQIYAEGWKAY